eukprot:CAMPEP_0197027720 /NCGR_PEP_ID=MMETSP1384-20130603/7594_1 /TAXON_ID=29189 /ORGANISM="Ammonia sp." /LENGTH=159 /DNA_ID=CAMNT_0042456611 /DNA_START=39 /DNA_END=518 /DNA_ORIENTATION=+
MSQEQSESTIYVGGLDAKVNSETLHAAFLPFGEIIHISIPMDQSTKEHRGYGFIEFEDPADAEHAMDNMDGSELFGRVLRVNVSRSHGNRSSHSNDNSKESINHRDKYRAVWSTDTDKYVQLLNKDEIEKQMKSKQEAQKILERARELAIRPSGPLPPK